MTMISPGRLSIPRPRSLQMQDMAKLLMQPPVGAVRGEVPDYINELIGGTQNRNKALRTSLDVDVNGLLKSIKAQNVGWKPRVSLPASQYRITGKTAPQRGSRAPNVNLKGGVDQWISQAYKILGLRLTPNALAHERYLIKKESGGNPRAVNRWDINWKRGTPSIGLAQTIMPTFQRHKVAGYNDIYNPVHNLLASLRYRKSRYGNYDIGFYKGGY